MPCRVDTYIWTNQTIVANADFCQVEHRAIVVGVEIIAHNALLTDAENPGTLHEDRSAVRTGISFPSAYGSTFIPRLGMFCSQRGNILFPRWEQSGSYLTKNTRLLIIKARLLF
jgi:hypothetical protein